MRHLLCYFLCLLCVLLVSSSNCRAQAITTADVDEPQVAKSLTVAGLNYLGGFVAQERRVASHLTVAYGMGLHYSFLIIVLIHQFLEPDLST